MDVSQEKPLISILEIQGIKFTSRNFQIEIELKQVMVLNNEPIFDNCLIKTKKSETPKIETIKTEIRQIDNSSMEHLVINENEGEDKNEGEDSIFSLDTIVDNNKNTSINDLDCLEQKINKTSVEESNDDLNIDIEDLNVEELNDSTELTEINLAVGLENDLDTFTLKKPNQVYFELYKEARNKAKLAKKSAIIAYLEAKNIRKTYMISTLNDSDSDFDAEIDDVSESELDGL